MDLVSRIDQELWSRESSFESGSVARWGHAAHFWGCLKVSVLNPSVVVRKEWRVSAQAQPWFLPGQVMSQDSMQGDVVGQHISLPC